MSRHSKKHKDSESSNSTGGFNLNNVDFSQMGNLLNGINPNQLTNMLGNFDMNQLTSMLQGFNTQNGENVQQNRTQSGDRRIELLNAIKPLVDAEKSKIIDSFIQMYTITKIVKR